MQCNIKLHKTNEIQVNVEQWMIKIGWMATLIIWFGTLVLCIGRPIFYNLEEHPIT